MSKSSNVCAEGFYVGLGGTISDVGKTIDSTTETKDVLPFFFAALGVL